MPSQRASAATNDFAADGWWNLMQMGGTNQLKAYVKPGETVYFHVMKGYYYMKSGGIVVSNDKWACANIGIYRDKISDGLAAGSNVGPKSTCSGNSPIAADTNVSWTNPSSGAATTVTIAFTASIGSSLDLSGGTDAAAGYKWRARVNNGSDITGRIWADPKLGLKMYQLHRDSAGTVDQALNLNSANFSFVYARNDGYRYLVDYTDFQGISSNFSSGIYGIWRNNAPAYTSINKGDTNYEVRLFDEPTAANHQTGNNAYLFVDCKNTRTTCIGTSIPGVTDKLVPPTSNSDIGNNPLRSPSDPDAFRYTGYSWDGGVYSGGTITVPYVQMQSGYIDIWIRDETTGQELCRSKNIIDNGYGEGTVTWNPTCQNGVSVDHKLGIYAQAKNLGEMHFVNTDVERRGGISSFGNGSYAATGGDLGPRGLIWRDPWTPSNGAGTYFHCSPQLPSPLVTYPNPRDSAGSSAYNHGWTAQGGDKCEGGAAPGTAKSTWGNGRHIEDWTYASKDPPAQTFFVGPYTWNINAQMLSAVNPADPANDGAGDVYTSSIDKRAYPQHGAFGDHDAKTTDDQIYYKSRVIRSRNLAEDNNPGAATFSYNTNWLFGQGLMGNVNAKYNTALIPAVQAICGNSGNDIPANSTWSYDLAYNRCIKRDNSWINISISAPRGTTVILPTAAEAATKRSWNNSLTSPNPLTGANSTLPLRRAIGNDACYFLAFSRKELTQTNDTNFGRYHGINNDEGSNGLCHVHVAYPWILFPETTTNIGSNRGTEIEIATGDEYGVISNVKNSEVTTEGAANRVQLVRVIGPQNWTPKDGLNTMGNNQTVDCTTSGVTNCTKFDAAGSVGRAESAQIINNGPMTNSHYTVINQIFDEAWYGKRVCYYTVISSGGWAYDKPGEVRYSKPMCVKWTKSPQIQLRGADSYAGGVWQGVEADGGFIGKSQTAAVRGSWSQYGLLAYKGAIREFGSAGWTMSTGENSWMQGACTLVFANINCPSSDNGKLFADSSDQRTIRLPQEATYTDSEIDSAATKEIPIDFYNTEGISDGQQRLTLTGLTSGVYRVPAGVLIRPSKIKSGQQIILISKGDIFIDGNITTEDAKFKDLKDVPILTVISMGRLGTTSHNTNNVTNIFGTYVSAGGDAREGFRSCVNNSNLSASVGGYDSANQLKDKGWCSSQLRVDGAVLSRKTPELRRTIGAGSMMNIVTTSGETHSDAATAAELFNYQPNMFLTPYALRSDANAEDATWVTTNQTVLPARY